MITAHLLRSWGACWPDSQIAERLAGRLEVTPRMVADDESISFDDRLWVLTKCIWHLDESAARRFAIDSALTVAHLAGDEDDQALFHGVMNDLLCAEDLTDAPAWDAAWAPAWDAARDAASAAAWDAAWDAAWAAAWDAARDAAWAAAWDAARDAAIQRALDWLGDYADGWEE